MANQEAPAVYSEYDTKVCRRSSQPNSRASFAFDVISTSRFFWINLQRKQIVACRHSLNGI